VLLERGRRAGLHAGAARDALDEKKSVPPALIFESKPRPSTVSAKVPWMSAQARTQREQTMHEEASKAK
jgi:hypothetical protein